MSEFVDQVVVITGAGGGTAIVLQRLGCAPGSPDQVRGGMR